MAIFKPEASNGTFIENHGICEFGLLEFRDKSGEFDWADLFIEVLVKQKDSEYDRVLQIKGSYEKEGNKIVGGSVLKRMYQFFDEIGCEAGIDIDGNWEDEKGNAIKDIAKYLNDNFITGNSETYEPNMDFIGYFYREHPKVPGGKSYSRVWNKIYKNKDENKPRLEKDVNWMKSKGYIKEITDEVLQKTEMSGSGLSNL
jgi:hypothetical protein